MWERSALSRMVNEQVRQLREPGAVHDALAPPTHNVANATVARRRSGAGTPIAVGDIIEVNGTIGQVVACIALDGAPYALLEVFAMHTVRLADVQMTLANRRGLVGFTDDTIVRHPSCWYPLEGGFAIVW